jgi:maltokinase
MKVFNVKWSQEHIKYRIGEILTCVDWKSFQRARWFQGKNKKIIEAKVFDFIDITLDEGSILILVLVKYSFKEDSQELYFIPLLLLNDERGQRDSEKLLRFHGPSYFYSLYEATPTIEYCKALSSFVNENKTFITDKGGQFAFMSLTVEETFKVKPLAEETSNTLSILYKNEILKTRRRIFPGINIEEEMLSALQTYTNFKKVPAIYGSIRYLDKYGEGHNLAVIESFIENYGNAWNLAIEGFKGLYDTTTLNVDILKEADKMGCVISQMHTALSELKGPVFEMEPIGLQEVKHILSGLQGSYERFCSRINDLGIKIKGSSLPSMKGFQNLLEDLKPWFISDLGKKIRIHGDLHLGNLLKTKDDFVIIDFEGEVLRSNQERQRKVSPLKDVAGMLRSFDYASLVALMDIIDNVRTGSSSPQSYSFFIEIIMGGPASESFNKEERRSKLMEEVSSAFLNGYLRSAAFLYLPEGQVAKKILLILFKLEKAFYEVEYEFANRPGWVLIPIIGVINTLNELRELVPRMGIN